MKDVNDAIAKVETKALLDDPEVLAEVAITGAGGGKNWRTSISEHVRSTVAGQLDELATAEPEWFSKLVVKAAGVNPVAVAAALDWDRIQKAMLRAVAKHQPEYLHEVKP